MLRPTQTKAASRTLVLRQNANADLPGRDADGEGEDDRSLIAIGHQNPIAQPATTCQIEFRLIQLNAFLGHGWAGILKNIAGCFFDLVRCRQPSSDKLEQVSANSVIFISFG